MSDETQTPQEQAPDAGGWTNHAGPGATPEQEDAEEAAETEVDTEAETESDQGETESTASAASAASAAQDGDEPAQLPLEKWSEHRLAEAGIELANHLHKLKVYEDGEKTHRSHYKANHDRMVDNIHGLRLRIREQRHALGIEEGAVIHEEEE